MINENISLFYKGSRQLNKLPKIRHSEIVVQTLDKELLIYDLKTNQAHQLNETSMIVFQACADGKTFEDLTRKYKFTENLINFALDDFEKLNLIESDYQTKSERIPRRELIKKIGLATAVALPVIVSMVAPKAMAAASGCAAAGTPVRTSITNPSNDTTTNQNLAGASLAAQCCSKQYENIVTNGCSFGAGQRCDAVATCI